MTPRSGRGILPTWVPHFYAAPATRRTFTPPFTRIALGEDVREICRDPDMPDRRTLDRWAIKDEAIAASLAHARVRQADTDFEELGQWEYAAIANPKAAAGYRVAGELRRWRLGRLKPGAYGAHSTVQFTGHIQHRHTHEAKLSAKMERLLGVDESAPKQVERASWPPQSSGDESDVRG